MVEIKQGTPQQSAELSQLILFSAPQLLPYLFGSNEDAMAYLKRACAQEDGQYAASRHYLATAVDSAASGIAPKQYNVIACMCLWHSDMPQAFHDGTIKSLAYHLNTGQLSHIVKVNETLRELFLPPSKDELCIGHFAVEKERRGQQIGSKLMAFAIRQAKSMGKAKLVLDVEQDNSEALSFYEKWNFRIVATKQFLPTKQQYLRMERPING